MLGISSYYSEFLNTQTDNTIQRKLAISGTGRYEVLQSLTISLAATAEKYYLRTNSDFPYHLNATSGLSYSFNHELTLSLNYMYDTKRNAIDHDTGAIEINKVIMELKMLY